MKTIIWRSLTLYLDFPWAIFSQLESITGSFLLYTLTFQERSSPSLCQSPGDFLLYTLTFLERSSPSWSQSKSNLLLIYALTFQDRSSPSWSRSTGDLLLYTWTFQERSSPSWSRSSGDHATRWHRRTAILNSQTLFPKENFHETEVGW